MDDFGPQTPEPGTHTGPHSLPAHLNASAADNSQTAARLCAACGMCCDGTLFHGMRLQPGDSERKLNALGLRSKRGQMAQPCPAHEGSCCSIYDNRPLRCRQFSCRQLLDIKAGKRSEQAALETIQETKTLHQMVLTLLRGAGENREHRPLAVRVAAAFTEPLNPTPEAVTARETLRPAMQKLEFLLTQNFRTEPSDPPIGEDPIPAQGIRR